MGHKQSSPRAGEGLPYEPASRVYAARRHQIVRFYVSQKNAPPSGAGHFFSAVSYPPKSVANPFDGVASLVVDRGAGTGLGPK